MAGSRCPATQDAIWLPHRPIDPRHDLGLASYGLVAVLEEGRGTRHPDMAWEPKRLFDTLAARYAARPSRM